MALPYNRSEVKDRAREWRGLCNVTLPSFTGDFAGLNPAGIAHDVRLAASTGYWGTLVASECGTTVDEYLAFLEIAADAAPKDFRLVAHLSFDTLDQCVRVAKAAEKLGVEAALPAYPPSFRPSTSADVVDWTTRLAGQTDLALVLFAVMTWGFKGLDTIGFPHDAIEELVNLDTVAALKYEIGGAASMVAFADAHRRFSERVVVENPMEHYGPVLMQQYGVRWFGTSGYEALGDRPPRWFDLIDNGKWDEAMELFWSAQPAREAKGAFHATFGGANLIHRVGWKYLGWLQGYNGGLLRMPQMRLTPGQMRPLRAGLAAAGYDLPPDDTGFYAGRNPA